MPPSVPTRPAAGAPVATLWGQWAHDWLKKRDVKRCTAALTLTTTAQDVTGLTMTLGAGWYIILAAIDFDTTAAGAGILQADLLIDGVAQTGSAFYRTEAAAAAGRASVVQVWIANIAGAGVIKIQGKKSSAGGTASITTQSALAVL